MKKKTLSEIIFTAVVFTVYGIIDYFFSILFRNSFINDGQRVGFMIIIFILAIIICFSIRELIRKLMRPK